MKAKRNISSSTNTKRDLNKSDSAGFLIIESMLEKKRGSQPKDIINSMLTAVVTLDDRGDISTPQSKVEMLDQATRDLEEAAVNGFNNLDRNEIICKYFLMEAGRLKKISTDFKEDEEKFQTKLAGWKLRSIIFHQLVQQKISHTFVHGEKNLKGSTIEVDLRTNEASDDQCKLLVELMVDLLTTAMVKMGFLSLPWRRVPDKGAFLCKGQYRSQQRELWQTAAKAFQKEHNLKFQSNHQIVKTTIRKFSRSMPPKLAGNDKDSQYDRYNKIFKAIQLKLKKGKFLQIHPSRRHVSDCPTLVQAHSNAGRIFISSNRNPTLSGEMLSVNDNNDICYH